MAATATYKYSVRDRSGKLISGSLEADSTAAVAAKLKHMGYAPVSIVATNTGMSREIKLPGFGGKVKLKNLAVMSRQFATMINSGLSLLRALDILASQTDNKELARVLGEVRNDVETGIALSTAMAKHPNVFPPLMVNMCRAGEVGGFLDSVLLQIAENFESEVKLRGKIKSAMTYPVVVFVISIIAVVGMLLFIVPVFVSMFDGMGGELPLPTKVLVWLSGFMKVAAPIGLVAFIVFMATWGKVKHDVRVRSVLDPIKLKVPVFGGLFQKIALSRFSRNLGTMLRSGVPILQSLEIVSATTGNGSSHEPAGATDDRLLGQRHRIDDHRALHADLQADGPGRLRRIRPAPLGFPTPGAHRRLCVSLPGRRHPPCSPAFPCRAITEIRPNRSLKPSGIRDDNTYVTAVTTRKGSPAARRGRKATGVRAGSGPRRAASVGPTGGRYQGCVRTAPN